mmetsp:Transcript_78712/g.188865  ORF Transcript_78712/g.188865 Transcript_78712/m.188865 type:complete len:201 (+) Transcript_78712:196-798(+)
MPSASSLASARDISEGIACRILCTAGKTTASRMSRSAAARWSWSTDSMPLRKAAPRRSCFGGSYSPAPRHATRLMGRRCPKKRTSRASRRSTSCPRQGTSLSSRGISRLQRIARAKISRLSSSRFLVLWLSAESTKNWPRRRLPERIQPGTSTPGSETHSTRRRGWPSRRRKLKSTRKCNPSTGLCRRSSSSFSFSPPSR